MSLNRYLLILFVLKSKANEILGKSNLRRKFPSSFSGCFKNLFYSCFNFIFDFPRRLYLCSLVLQITSYLILLNSYGFLHSYGCNNMNPKS